jgi:RNA polymerase primary sigma factor
LFDDVRAHSVPVTREQEKELGRRIQAGDRDAWRQLVLSHVRFAIKLAMPHRDKGVPEEDLYQEAFCGLFNAADKFDPELGNRFSTYAEAWIKAKIGFAFAAIGKSVVVPPWAVAKVRQVKRYRDVQLSEGRMVTVDQAVSELSLEPVVVDAVVASQNFLSLDHPIFGEDGGDDGFTVQDSIPGTDSCSEEAIDLAFQSEIKSMIYTYLTPLQRFVAIHYFGLFGEVEKPMTEIGKLCNPPRTRQSVFQILGDVKLRLKEPLVECFGDVVSGGVLVEGKIRRIRGVGALLGGSVKQTRSGTYG